MQRPGSGHDRLAFAPVDDIHEVGFDPALDNIPVLAETDETVAVLDDFIDELAYRQFPLVPEHAGITAVFEALEQPGQNPIHLDVFEIEIGDLGQAEFAVFFLYGHRLAPARRWVS